MIYIRLRNWERKREIYEESNKRQAVTIQRKCSGKVASGGLAVCSLVPSGSVSPSLKHIMKMKICDKYNYVEGEIIRKMSFENKA